MAQGAKGKAAKSPKPVMPTIDWIGNNNTFIWELLNKFEKNLSQTIPMTHLYDL